MEACRCGLWWCRGMMNTKGVCDGGATCVCVCVWVVLFFYLGVKDTQSSLSLAETRSSSGYLGVCEAASLLCRCLGVLL